MDLGSFFGVLRRRWLIVVICLVLTAGAALAALKVFKPTYSSSASVTLLGPSEASGPGGAEKQNPYLGFGSGIENMATIMQEQFLDPGLAAKLQARGATGTYGISAAGSIVTIDVDATTPPIAEHTLKELLEQFQTTLRERQIEKGAPETQLITTSVLRESQGAIPKQGSRVRVLVIVLVLGIVAAVGLAFVVEALSAPARARRRARRQAEGEEMSALERDANRRNVGWRDELSPTRLGLQSGTADDEGDEGKAPRRSSA